jgi:hypothetical protein
MPDIDEHQSLMNEKHKYSLQNQPNIQIINNIIPDIWKEIGKKRVLKSILSRVIVNNASNSIHSNFVN